MHYYWEGGQPNSYLKQFRSWCRILPLEASYQIHEAWEESGNPKCAVVSPCFFLFLRRFLLGVELFSPLFLGGLSCDNQNVYIGCLHIISGTKEVFKHDF